MMKLKYAFQRKVSEAQPRTRMMNAMRKKLRTHISARFVIESRNEDLQVLMEKVEKV